MCFLCNYRPELRRRSERWTIRSPSVYPETRCTEVALKRGVLKKSYADILRNSWRTEMIYRLLLWKTKSRYTHITTTSQTQQLFLMSQDLFDCYVSVTALNLRYHKNSVYAVRRNPTPDLKSSPAHKCVMSETFVLSIIHSTIFFCVCQYLNSKKICFFTRNFWGRYCCTY